MDDGRHALLVVDVQKGFVNEQTAHIPALVEALQYRYDDVFVTRFVNASASPYRTLLCWDGMAPETEDVSFAFRVRPDAVILEKDGYTCVTPSFLAMLRDRGVTAVDICGVDTDACVLKCAMDLFESGVRPVVLASCCASSAGSAAHAAALDILVRVIGRDQVV